MKRILHKTIKEKLKGKKVIIIIGQRQVGKTTELKTFLHGSDITYIDLEDRKKRALFEVPSLDHLQNLLQSLSNPHLLLLDEIQTVENVGSTLKLLHDHFPQVRIIATGSASFLLLKHAGDSLYGRHVLLSLYPLHLREIFERIDVETYVLGNNPFLIEQPKIDTLLPSLLRFGTLPEVVTTPGEEEKRELLIGYTRSLLFKDIFELEGIRHPERFKKLLSLLALQIGQEVKLTELAGQLELSRPTVLEYIHLYEKFQIVKIVRSYSTNTRKEISKGFKVYFVDLGIRNAVIENFTPLDLRNDKGNLFENFVFMQLYTAIEYYKLPLSLYFWRTPQQAEVDVVLEHKETKELIPIEIKWAQEKLPTRSFANFYKERVKQEYCITKENLWRWM